MKSSTKQRGNTLFEVSLGCGVALLAGLALLKVGGMAADQATDLTTVGPSAVVAMEANHRATPAELCRIEFQATGTKPAGCP